MKRVIICLLVISLGLLLKSCNTVDPPPGDKPTLTLKLEDVSCTEAWIELTTTNLQLPATITLKQINPNGDTLSQVSILNTKDSLLYIDSLLPNQSYTLIASHSSAIGGLSGISSNELSVTTMDTTSHEFTYEAYVFGGQYQSSILFDVAIVSENSIWAVGEIYLLDSIGHSIRYNAAHWDGTEWKLYRIMFYTFCGQQHQNAYPASSIIAFSEEEMWIAMKGDQIAKIENGIQTQTLCLPWSFSISKIWGRSSDDLYVVGSNGNIARYFNGSWRRIFSGTTLGLTDIYGNENGEIYACGGNLSTGQGIVLKINSNNTVTKIIDSYYYGSGFDSTKLFVSQLYGPLSCVWIDEYGNLITAGNFIFRYKKSKWNYAPGIFANYIGAGQFTRRGYVHGIDGNKMNDFCFIGEYGTVQHYNGYTAIQIGEQFNYQSEYDYYGVDMKNDCIVVVGRKSLLATIRVFKRR
jgi:hypothetical protein